jgi:carbon-monoxide dehydrogenase medium subunit
VYPRTFDYSAPEEIPEALAMLADTPGAKVLAGGMSLIPMMKLRLLSPPVLIDIGRLPGLATISEQSDGITIGALVRHRDVAGHTAIAGRASALADAASWTGDVQVRNRGTLCGALAHADSAADQTAAVLALGGTLVVRSTAGVRTLAADEFFVDAFTSALRDDEMLTAVRIPGASRGEGSAYRKLGGRGGTDGFAVAGSAAWVRVEDATVVDARVALTGVSTKPLLAGAAAEAVVGTDGSAAAVRSAADLAAEGVTLIADLQASEDYKAHMSRILTAQALTAALSRARGRDENRLVNGVSAS